MQSVAELEESIREIIRKLPPEPGKHTLRCTVDGTSSGIPVAFVDALDRIDQSGRSSERLHILIAQLGAAVASNGVSDGRQVFICLEGDEISFHYEPKRA
jgi:hypothetical protein